MVTLSTRLPIYVIHWNAPEWCSATVESLLASRDVELDLTVIDNASTALPQLPESVNVVRLASNRGYSGAANHALDLFLARPDVPDLCMIACHDLRVEPDALKLVVEGASSHPDYGILGVNGEGGSRDHGIIEREWVSGTFLALRRACVEAVGGFDERYGSYIEDIDFCYRAGGVGWKAGIVARARGSALGSVDSRRAIIMTHANFALLDVKRGRYFSTARRILGLVRRCVTSPRELGIWGPSLLLACQQVLRWAVRAPQRRRRS